MRLKFRRGNSANLPQAADSGELLLALDTKDIYLGNGDGFPLSKMTGKPHADRHITGDDVIPVATTSEAGLMSSADKSKLDGIDGSATVYEFGTGTTKSYVIATGQGVTLTKSTNSAVLNAPAGVRILGTSIHFESSEISATSITIDYTNCGLAPNSSYSNIYVPQFQVWQDISGNRAFKTAVAGHLNAGAGILTLTNLTASQAIWINMSF
jgi:hypothetical protein